MKKIIRILLMVLFPLGILFCIGKCLFSGGFYNFLGGIFLFAAGIGLSIYFFRYDLIQSVLLFIERIFG